HVPSGHVLGSDPATCPEGTRRDRAAPRSKELICSINMVLLTLLDMSRGLTPCDVREDSPGPAGPSGTDVPRGQTPGRARRDAGGPRRLLVGLASGASTRPVLASRRG